MIFNKIITKKSILLIFVFVLFYSFSVYGYVLEDETYSDNVIADSLAFEKAHQSAGAKTGVRTLSLAGSPPIIIWGETLNSVDVYTDKYKPLEVYRRGSESYVRRYMKNFFPSKHRYASSWTGPNGYDLPYAYESYCWWSDSLPGLICDMKFRLPDDAPVGTYTVTRDVYDKQTGGHLYSRTSNNYMIFNPYDSDSDVGGLDLNSIKAYAYDSSREGRDETGVWFFAEEYKDNGSWYGRDYGQQYDLHPFDKDVFLEIINQINGYRSAILATNKLRVYTDSLFESKGLDFYSDTSSLRFMLMFQSKIIARCASQANFLVEALRSVGIPSRPIGGDGNQGRGWNYHTWVEAFIGDWVVGDAFYHNDFQARKDFVNLKDEDGKMRYGKQVNDLLLVAKPGWSYDGTHSGFLGLTIGDIDISFKYVPGNEKGEHPSNSVPAQNFNKFANWIDELSEEYWGEPYYYPRQHSTPQDYDLIVTTDKESYNIGETMMVTVNVSSNLDFASSPLVKGEVLRDIPLTKGPMKETLHSFEKNVNLPAYGSYQFVEYYNVSEDLVTIGLFNIVVSIENISTISFFDIKSLMSLDVKTPNNIAQDELFVASVTVSNNNSITLENIEVALEQMSYRLQTEDSLVQYVPSLLPGQSEVLTWDVTGISPGDAELIFNVSSENGGIDKIGALVKVKGYPELFTNVSAPSSAGAGEGFDVVAEVFNVGGLTAEGVTATLSLAPNLTTSESLIKTIGDIEGGSSASVTWAVKSDEEDFYYMKVDVSDATGKYTGLSGSSINITKKSPYQLKLEALNKLKELRTGKQCSRLFWWTNKNCVYEHRVNKAVYYLEQSLNRAYWLDDYTLSPKFGHKVFNNEREAVRQLMKIKTSEAVGLSEQLAFGQFEEVKDEEDDI